MNSQKFSNLMTEAGYTVVGKSAYGMIGDFSVLASLPSGQMVNLHFSAAPGTLDTFKKSARKVRKALKGIGGLQLVGKDYFTIILPAKEKVLLEKHAQMVEVLLPLLNEHGVRPNDICPHCQQGDCDIVARHSAAPQDHYRPMHQACLSERLEKLQAKADNQLNNGSYALGWLGGLLGGLLACIPSILSIWFAETAYSLLYALIPLGVYYGYKLFKGKMDRSVIVVTIVLSVILSVSIDLIIVALAMVSWGIPVYYMFELLLDPEFLIDFVGDAITSLLFVGLGIYLTWGQISRNAHGDIANADEVLASSRPLRRDFNPQI